MDTNNYISLFLYYGRTKFYHAMQRISLDGLAKYPTLSVFRLLNGMSLVLSRSNIQQGIRELNSLRNTEVSLSAIVALIHAHNDSDVVDVDLVKQLEHQLNDKIECSTATACYLAASFLHLAGNNENALEYVDRALKYDPKYEMALSLKAWIQIDRRKLAEQVKISSFEDASDNNRTIDAYLCQIRCYQAQKQYDKALTLLAQISTRFPEQNIFLVEKMEILYSTFKWDEAYETARRIINLDSTNIPALRMEALYMICRQCNWQGGYSMLKKLISTIENTESGNNYLLLYNSQLFARLCSRNKDILSLTSSCVEKLNQSHTPNMNFKTELGYQFLLRDNIDSASECFRAAISEDKICTYALCGLITCQILSNESVELIEQQLAYIEEASHRERNARYLHLKSKITTDNESAIKLLVECIEQHMKDVNSDLIGSDFLRRFNPDFLLQVSVDLLMRIPIPIHGTFKILSNDSADFGLKNCLNLLDTIIKYCPGHKQAIFIRAKVLMLFGNQAGATSTLYKLVNEIDRNCANAYLLLAKVQLAQKLFSKATQSLEKALSLNFAVRDHPMYFLLLGILQSQRKSVDACKNIMKSIQLLESDPFKKIASNYWTSHYVLCDDNFLILTRFDKVMLYMEILHMLKQIGSKEDVVQLINMALSEFDCSSEKGLVLIAQSEFYLQNYNISKALSLLNSIPADHLFYVEAQSHIASIYLKYRNDRVSFVSRFKMLSTKYPESTSYLLLGEAYMSIQEPDMAISAFQAALYQNPSNSQLASKLGRTLVKSHKYTEAIQYYRSAIKNFKHSNLKLELAELYLQLKKYESAIESLSLDLEEINMDKSDTYATEMYTKQLLLLSRILEKSGKLTKSLDILREARSNQIRIQKSISCPTNLFNDNNTILAKINFLLAQQSSQIFENEQALHYFKEALKFSPNNIEILTAHAQLYMKLNMMENCSEVCNYILKIEKNNEAASVMMADVSLRKVEFTTAGYHLSQLLLSNPYYWRALARLINVLWRIGTLIEAEAFLQRVELSKEGLINKSGLEFCKGIYEWYTGNPNQALRCLNSARTDSEWGSDALAKMIEICINPDDKISCVEYNTQEFDDGTDLKESRLIALHTANRLLKEFSSRQAYSTNTNLNYVLLRNFLYLASKQKSQIELALENLTKISKCKDFEQKVGPQLGIAYALLLLKQTQRARAMLKRIGRIAWNFAEAEYLESSWLLLASIYVNGNKFDDAEVLIERVLKYNKSSIKAYELGGLIAEKTQAFQNAVKYYQKAWQYASKSKPYIGYKLAYNLMKIKSYAEAIKISQSVIKFHPDYAVIHKDIYEKCRYNLKY